MKLIATTTADPATPAKNMTSKRRMKKIAISTVIDCISFPVSCYGKRLIPQEMGRKEW